MNMPGTTEIVVILIVALLIFGPRKLPEMGKAIGGAINEFKDAISGAKKTDDKPPEPKKLEKKPEEEDNTPAG